MINSLIKNKTLFMAICVLTVVAFSEDVVAQNGFGSGKVYYTDVNGTSSPAPFYEYDVASDTWTQRASLPGRNWTQLAADEAGNVYSLPVAEPLGPGDGNIYVYNTGADTWDFVMKGIYNRTSGTSPGKMFAAHNGEFYWALPATRSFWYTSGGSWFAILSPDVLSGASSIDRATGTLYIRTFRSRGFFAFDTGSVKFLPKICFDNTNIPEPARAGSFYNGDFFSRTETGKYLKINVVTCVRLDTGVAPTAQNTASAEDGLGNIYSNGRGSGASIFEVFHVPTNTLLRLADAPVIPGNAYSTLVAVLADTPPDSDGDGVPDDEDICPGGDDNVDTDGDGVPDFCDPCPLDVSDDSDGDGVCDSDDICPGFDDFSDADADGIPDGCDDCPNDPDNDADGDGVCGDVDICPGFDDNLDNDGDGIPDGCDPDDDNDGLTDVEEIALQVFGGCPNPFEPDSDFDGINDFIEVTLGLNPCGSINDDQDGDGLTDAAELNTHGTDPNNADTDGDGMEDGTEVDVAAGGICPDPLNPDSDGDTLEDGAEVDAGTDPCSTDTDGDGVADNDDPDPLNPGVTGDFEADLRDLGAYIRGLDLPLFEAPNNNARKGRRNAMCNKLNAAARAVAKDDIQDAIDQLTSLLAKLDGDTKPKDWMVEGSLEKLIVHDTIAALRSLLEFLL